MKKIKSVRVDRFAVLFLSYWDFLVVLRLCQPENHLLHLLCIIECSKANRCQVSVKTTEWLVQITFSRQKG